MKIIKSCMLSTISFLRSYSCTEIIPFMDSKLPCLANEIQGAGHNTNEELVVY